MNTFTPLFDHILEWARMVKAEETKKMRVPAPHLMTLVYGRIWRYHNAYKVCWVEYPKLGYEIGAGLSTVQRSIKLLERDIFLFVHPREDDTNLITLDYTTYDQAMERFLESIGQLRKGGPRDMGGLSVGHRGGLSQGPTNIQVSNIQPNKQNTSTTGNGKIDKDSPQYKAAVKLAILKKKENPENWAYKGFQKGWIWDYPEMSPWKERDYLSGLN